MGVDDSFPDDVITLKAMLRAERTARLAAEADAQAQILLIEKLKLTIRKLRHEQFGHPPKTTWPGAVTGCVRCSVDTTNDPHEISLS